MDKNRDKIEDTEEFEDFIPYKVGKRIKEAIIFTLRIEGRDPSLMAKRSYDEATEKKLKELEDLMKDDIKLKNDL